MMDPLEHLQMLKDRAAGLGSRRVKLDRVRALRFTEPGFDRDAWHDLCAEGALALRGGEQCRLAEKLGAELAPEPLVAAAMAAQLLPPDQQASVFAGDRIVLPAWQEAPDSLALAGETALRDGRLNGRKSSIPMAAGADAFLVTLREGLALVERDAPGVSLQISQTDDGGNLGTLVLEDAPATWTEGDATEALEQAIMAHCAYLLGLTDQAFALTLDVIKQRQQSGHRIDSAEALQHRADDMEIQLSLTKATLDNALQQFDAAPTLARRQGIVSRAKLRVSDAAVVVARTCLQLHGGLGHVGDIGLYAGKAMALAPMYGSSSAHRRRLRAD